VGGAGIWTWQVQRSLREAEKAFQARQNRENAEASLARLDELYRRFLWAEDLRQPEKGRAADCLREQEGIGQRPVDSAQGKPEGLAGNG
jgi:hypothetical protein